MTRPRLDNIQYNRPTKDGEYDAILYKHFIKGAEETNEIYHNLGRVPRKIQIVWADNPIEIPQIDYADQQKAILTFFESYTNIILRIE